MIPLGVHGSGTPGSPCGCNTNSPRFMGWSPSASFPGSIALITSVWLMCFGNGSWTMYPVQSGFPLRPRTASNTSSCDADSGRSMRIESMPTSVQSLCLPATYLSEPGSSPTSTVPRPTGIPASRSLATRALRSSLMLAAVALPSRMICWVSLILETLELLLSNIG